MTLRYRLPPFERGRQLKQLLKTKNGIRIIEVHNGLSAIVGSTTFVTEPDGAETAFDGLWVSSLTDSAAKGHPDTEVIDPSSRLHTIQEIAQVSNKPIIVDGDTGGEATNFEYFCAKLESLGVSAVIIEDKKYPKRNSLEGDSSHLLEDPYFFAEKINRGKQICLSDHFLIFSRIESFIAGLGLDDALMRAEIYLDSAADGILIHSRAKTPAEIINFSEAYQRLCLKKNKYKPLICVPTKYNEITDNELFNHGFQVVIYANHMLRAAHKAMNQTCLSILKHKRSKEADALISPIDDLLHIVGYEDVTAKDSKAKQNTTPVVILAAGKPKGFAETEIKELAISNIPIANATLLEWQLSTLKQANLANITLLTGYQNESVNASGVEVIFNPKFQTNNFLSSLLLTREKLNNGFILTFGDIFFDKYLLINYVLNANADIALLVDNSFNLRIRKNIKSTTDLVVLKNINEKTLRKLHITSNLIDDIGNHVSLDLATHEFTGISRFSKNGAALFFDMVDELLATEYKNSAERLDFYTVLRALIRKNIPVQAIEANQGWSEVHSMTDITAIEKVLNHSTFEFTL